MKINFFILLVLAPLLSYSQVTIPREQIDNVYKGLKGYEWYKEHYPKAVQANDSLVGIIREQHCNLETYIKRQQQHDAKLIELYEQKEKLAVKIEKNKSLGWLWFGLGTLTGILITTQIK